MDVHLCKMSADGLLTRVSSRLTFNIQVRGSGLFCLQEKYSTNSVECI